MYPDECKTVAPVDFNLTQELQIILEGLRASQATLTVMQDKFEISQNAEASKETGINDIKDAVREISRIVRNNGAKIYDLNTII